MARATNSLAGVLLVRLRAWFMELAGMVTGFLRVRASAFASVTLRVGSGKV